MMGAERRKPDIHVSGDVFRVRPRLCENTIASHGISSSSLFLRNWLYFALVGRWKASEMAMMI
jgi:hypothetical protein